MSCNYNTDESDWDSDSASSQRNSPGQRMASPGLEEQNCSRSSVKEQVEDDCSDAPMLPQRSIVARESSKSPPPLPCPQPSARKMVLQKKETVKGQILFAILLNCIFLNMCFDTNFVLTYFLRSACDLFLLVKANLNLRTQMCLILLCFVFLGSPEQLSPIHGQINVASDEEQQRVRCFIPSIQRNYNFIVSSCKSLPDLKILSCLFQ